jgi:hypothetical protein
MIALTDYQLATVMAAATGTDDYVRFPYHWLHEQNPYTVEHASIRLNGKTRSVGLFASEQDAARAYKG